MEHGQPIPTKIDPTLADGLAVPEVGFNAFATALPLLDKMIVVREEWIALAILRLVEQEKCNYHTEKKQNSKLLMKKKKKIFSV